MPGRAAGARSRPSRRAPVAIMMDMMEMSRASLARPAFTVVPPEGWGRQKAASRSGFAYPRENPGLLFGHSEPILLTTLHPYFTGRVWV